MTKPINTAEASNTGASNAGGSNAGASNAGGSNAQALTPHFDFLKHEAELYQQSSHLFAPVSMRSTNNCIETATNLNAHLNTDLSTALNTTADSNSFSIMMPPPNVTGSLHLGHALTYTLQDIVVRFKRAQGFDTLWQPGTDHAGISTQIVVERQLEAQGQQRLALGREKFLDEVWRWKKISGDTIVKQQQALCVSAPWELSRFTLDEGLSEAVVEAFVKLYNDGLIYKGKRLVNWDPKLQTAVSDLEVVVKEETNPFWYIKYLIVNNVNHENALTEATQEYLIVATTRPETMFGDVAVAVNPEDERYKHLIGAQVVIPLIGRTIPIIADDYCNIEKGSGAVKITPAHDFNDFEVGLRHKLEPLIVIDKFNNLMATDLVPEQFQNLAFKSARGLIVKQLEHLGLIEKVESIVGPVPYGEKTSAEIQPYLTDQWFVDAAKLAPEAIEAVKSGAIKFLPKHWKNTYFEWLNNIQPWCISRQIWWGHQIPAWYGPDQHIFVAKNFEQAQAQALIRYGKPVELIAETDVLDTWFSSALWPFSTLGWPQNSAQLLKFYPTSALITGFDIIFFWVARMIMFGLYFMKEVPFKTIYVHALVRDEHGHKMSKTKGNVIDPLIIINKYGSDALRFTLATLCAPGRDIKLGEANIAGNRNFVTKIWNAARFIENMDIKLTNINLNDLGSDSNVESSVESSVDSFVTDHDFDQLSSWIINELNLLINRVTLDLENYRFDLASQAIYQHFWYTFCDQYLEGIKVLKNNNTGEIVMWCFKNYLILLHPFMPSVTTHLAKNFKFSECLTGEGWPRPITSNHSTSLPQMFALISEVRSCKGLLNLNPALKLDATLMVSSNDAAYIKQIEQLLPMLTFMCRLNTLKIVSTNEATNYNSTQTNLGCVVGDLTLHLNLGQTIDLQAINELLQQKVAKLEVEIVRLNSKIGNEAYRQAKFDKWSADVEQQTQRQQEQLKIKTIIASLGKHI